MKTLQTTRLTIAALMLSGIFVACDSDNDPGIDTEVPVFSSNANLSTDENKPEGGIITDVKASGVPNEIVYELTGGDHENAFTIDPVTGRLTVLDGTFFNYEENTSLNVEVSATNDAGTASQQITVNINDLEDERYLEYTHPDNPNAPGVGGRAGVNVSYGPDQWHLMNVWEPLNDSEPTNRPVILFAGGGVFGDPSHKEAFWGMANNMSQRGYVAAYVYFTRINGDCGIFGCDGTDVPTAAELMSAFIQNIQDLKGAIRFLRQNADDYGIDPDQIYVGGWSTGGNIMFQSAMMDENYKANSDSPELNTVIDDVISDLGGIEGDLNPGFSSEINGVMAMMISTYDMDLIDSNDSKLLLVNHENAVTGADCESGDLRTGNWTTEFIDGFSTSNFGTDAIFEKAVSVGINSGDKTFIETDVELTEDMDYGYFVMQGNNGGNFCPNVSILTSANYNFIANFYYRLTKED